MISTLHLSLTDALKTKFAGKSLAHTLYHQPVTIFLNGDLGAGKTTLLQGFAKELGIEDPLVSPTYALEQRYTTKNGHSFLHLDLYRLQEKEAMALVESTENHTGIRCIEWADRLPRGYFKGPSVTIQLDEDGEGRTAAIHFSDFPLPDNKQVDDWRAEVMLPAHITRHCNAVANVAMHCADGVIQRGIIVRKDALRKAAELHDLFRFVDFRASPPAGVVQTEKVEETWRSWKETYAGLRHEDACTAFLTKHGYPELGKIVETHGLRIPEKAAETIEQKLLFYADKRVMMDKVVSVQERFNDFLIRYTNGQQTEQNSLWLNFTLELERELFPEGAPNIDEDTR
jgi:tRNA threonylcarbamoyladenosine biosynthesis protein TsaE